MDITFGSARIKFLVSGLLVVEVVDLLCCGVVWRDLV